MTLTIETEDVVRLRRLLAFDFGDESAHCIALAETAGAVLQSLSERIAVLEKHLDDLQQAEGEYRLMHDRHGGGSMASGRAWDRMRHTGDIARATLNRESN